MTLAGVESTHRHRTESAMNHSDKLFIQSVIDSCYDRNGEISTEGQSLRGSYLYALRAKHADPDEAVLWRARSIKSAAESLRCAGRVPVIRR